MIGKKQIGIDIDGDVRLVQLFRRGDRYRLEQCSLLNDIPLRIKRVILALPDSLVIEKQVELDANLSDKEVLLFLNQNCLELVGLPTSEINFDFERLMDANDKGRVILIAAKRAQIDERVGLITAKRSRVTALDVESRAIARALRFCGVNNCIQVVINIQQTALLFIVMHYERIINVESVRIEVTEVAQVVDLLHRKLQLLSVGEHQQPDNVIIAGSYTGLVQIAELFRESAPFTVELANPFSKLSFAKSIDQEFVTKNAAHFMLSFGLALWRFVND